MLPLSSTTAGVPRWLLGARAPARLECLGPGVHERLEPGSTRQKKSIDHRTGSEELRTERFSNELERHTVRPPYAVSEADPNSQRACGTARRALKFSFIRSVQFI
jgi:hypothetical protein